MNIVNVHKRVLNQPKENISKLLETLATEHDEIIANDKWSPMKLNEGLKEGSIGGHGPIKYTVTKYIPGNYIQFEFTRPKGFNGSHSFEITELEGTKTEIKHTIEMNTTVTGTLIWIIAIRWLHDAFMEDSFDKVENKYLSAKKKTEWNIWVKVLRRLLKPKKAHNGA